MIKIKKIILLLSIFLLFSSFVVAEDDLNKHFLNVGESVEVNGKIVKLIRVGSAGAVTVDVDGIQAIIQSLKESVINCLVIRNKETFYDSDDPSAGAATLEIFEANLCNDIITEPPTIIEKEAQKVDDNKWFFEVNSKVELFGKTIKLLDVYEDGTVVVQVGKPTVIIFSQESRTVPSSILGDISYNEQDVFYIKIENEESFYAPIKADRAATLKISQGDESEIETPEPGEKGEERKEIPEQIRECNGCLDENNNCIPVTVRIGNKFCDINKELKPQLLGESYCNNNYECSSNVCVSNKCISTGFLEKIFAWFKKIFG